MPQNGKSETPGAAAAVAGEAEECTNGEDVDLDLVCLFTSQDSPQLVRNEHREAKWFLDSGATSHMAFKRSPFVSYEKVTPSQFKWEISRLHWQLVEAMLG